MIGADIPTSVIEDHHTIQLMMSKASMVEAPSITTSLAGMTISSLGVNVMTTLASSSSVVLDWLTRPKLKAVAHRSSFQHGSVVTKMKFSLDVEHTNIDDALHDPSVKKLKQSLISSLPITGSPSEVVEVASPEMPPHFS
uniref:Uncharacterized protein n=1 Tax=Nelumbo nucifera TaxID=4432 RepID=A0A822YKM8_NELNU|nr:TPA_asm: hypothetical protein HUJ06_010972 [Nelumbo nucifera]